MGIPGLASHLHKYGTITTLPQRKKSDLSARTAAIIDGPALAHSIAYQIRSSINPTAFIPHPNYDAIGTATIRWLDRLRSYGYEIEGIYFDAALPTPKTPVRLARLQTYVSRLVDYRQLHAQASKNNTKSQLPDSRTLRILEKAKNGLPPPPFLVPAVVECLLGSRYADRTWLVNGEADAFCAAAAEEVVRVVEEGSVVFTNDSDLVVFEFEAGVRVAMINELREVGGKQGNVLEVFEFDVPGLRERLRGVGVDLGRSAFVTGEEGVGFAEAVRRQEAIDVGSPSYLAFKEDYSLPRWTVELHELKSRKSDGTSTPLLDARISEPIHQLGTEELAFYLPVLLEDTTRGTAWKIGFAFREVAAQLILTYRQHPATSLLEHRRSGTRVHATPIHAATPAQLEANLTDLSERVTRCTKTVTTSLPDPVRHRAAIMSLLLDDLPAALPPRDDILAVLVGDVPAKWAVVHLDAQFQAMFYSLRMLGQVARWRQARPGPRTLAQGGNAAVQLGMGGPGIGDFFDLPVGWRGVEGMGRWQDMVKEMVGMVSVLDTRLAFEEDADADGNSDMIDDSETRAGFGYNPFAVLGQTRG